MSLPNLFYTPQPKPKKKFITRSEDNQSRFNQTIPAQKYTKPSTLILNPKQPLLLNHKQLPNPKSKRYLGILERFWSLKRGPDLLYDLESYSTPNPNITFSSRYISISRPSTRILMSRVKNVYYHGIDPFYVFLIKMKNGNKYWLDLVIEMKEIINLLDTQIEVMKDEDLDYFQMVLDNPILVSGLNLDHCQSDLDSCETGVSDDFWGWKDEDEDSSNPFLVK